MTFPPLGRLGHHRLADGRSAFRVFAPEKLALRIVFDDGRAPLVLHSDALGYWSAATEALPAGTRYRVEVDGAAWPDPASRSQPDGVHGPSEVVDIAPAASPGWRGVEIEDAVIYELHVGTFTPEGTLVAATQRLGHLAGLGVNVVELMPLAAFPGERNWGYDGVQPFALHAAYGSWAELRQFIEQAHALGIAVLLDVVYNHFGPEGNYSGRFAPYTRAAATPWGAAINFDGEYAYGVREYFAENLRFWIEDVGFDGVRLDAASEIHDNSPVPIVRELSELAREIGRRQRRTVLTIAEHLRNNARVTAADGLGCDAQWNDDLNHALVAWLTGERWRHYASFGRFEDVVTALARGWVLDGTRLDRFRRHFTGSDPASTLPREHVVHVQNHDQVGNRPGGERLAALVGPERALLAAVAMFASPFVPMLFMGEEWGETAPFLFFEDFGDRRVVRGVRAGRRAENGFVPGFDPPNPHARSTFLAAKLRWQRAATPEGRFVLERYRTLIALKRAGDLGPRERGAVQVAGDAATKLVRLAAPRTLTWLNLGPDEQAIAVPEGWTEVLCSAPTRTPGRLPGHAAIVFRAGA
ncbi:malto-oligosyltrehalose trehalohydrolase [Rubrivivax sp. JA1026]|uniref:malto-oligosyltrehalose trehalohydrolase n=1 Tax=Rubrivivax sp. JA1026 TaxID=2710888 RepID=UPI0013E936C2|nr:malto-oligosyltrehalose trehalohydrolase [Rubrivivax sp. JA1026]